MHQREHFLAGSGFQDLHFRLISANGIGQPLPCYTQEVLWFQGGKNLVDYPDVEPLQ